MNYYPTFFITGASASSGKIILRVSGSPSLENRGVATFLFAPGVLIPEGAKEGNEAELKIAEKTYPLFGKFSERLLLSEMPAARGYFRPRSPIVCGIGENGDGFYFISWNLPQPTEYVIKIKN